MKSYNLILGALAVFFIVSGFLQYQDNKKMQATIEQTMATLDQVQRQVDKALVIDSLQSARYKQEKQAFDSLLATSSKQLRELDKTIKNQSYNVWKLRQTFDSLRVDLPEL